MKEDQRDFEDLTEQEKLLALAIPQADHEKVVKNAEKTVNQLSTSTKASDIEKALAMYIGYKMFIEDTLQVITNGEMSRKEFERTVDEQINFGYMVQKHGEEQ